MARVIRRPGPGKAQLEAMLQALQDTHVRVGWLEKEVYEDGTPAAYIAAIHEYGVPEKGIPPRPIRLPTVEANHDEWKQEARQMAAKVAKGELTVNEGMRQLGALAAGNLKTTIGQISSPPLAEATVAARRRKKERGNPIGSLTKPLQETAYLHSSVDFEVTDGKPQGGGS